jgi:hypothetical protein
VSSPPREREEGVAECGQELWGGLGPDLTAILGKEDISLPVPTLDRPMPTNEAKQYLGAGLCCRAVGDVVPGLLMVPTGGAHVSTDLHRLLDAGKEEMGGEVTRSRRSSQRPCCRSTVVVSVTAQAGSVK